MHFSIIAAMAKNHVIGRDGRLPWKLPRDMKWFSRHTKGHPVIMGRKTYESIGGPLKDRTNIVLTTRKSYEAPGCIIAHAYSQAFEIALHAPGADEIFVIGGSAIFAEFLPLADTMYLTRVDAEIDGDTLFPTYDTKAWKEILSERHPADSENKYPITFVILKRIAAPQ